MQKIENMGLFTIYIYVLRTRSFIYMELQMQCMDVIDAALCREIDVIAARCPHDILTLIFYSYEMCDSYKNRHIADSLLFALIEDDTYGAANN